MKRSLIFAVSILLVIDLALVFLHIEFRHILGFFDLDKEGSAKAVLSGMQLIASGVFAGIIVLLYYRLNASWKTVTRWIFVSILFFLLAFDDMMMVHERIGFVLNRWTDWHGTYESFNWLIYFFPFMLFGGAVLGLSVRDLFHIGRNKGILAACGLFGFFGTLGMEYIGGELLKKGSIPWYHLSIIVEEFILLLSESLFLAALASCAAVLFTRAYVHKIVRT